MDEKKYSQLYQALLQEVLQFHSGNQRRIRKGMLSLLLVPLAALAGLGSIDGGLPLRVVTVLSCMPVAMTALVPPALFGLDVDMANALWIFSTLALVVILPVLYFVLPLL